MRKAQLTSRVSQRRESVLVPVERQWPGVAALDVRHQKIMTNSGTQVAIFAVLVVSSLIAHFATRYRQPFLVQRWARDNGFRILECELRRVRKGPFTWKVSGRGQCVCRVRVRDLDNRERSAWLRCTDVGISNDDKTEVVWETEI